MVGTSGSLSKRSVYNHYLSVTKQVTKKPLISPTFFGKLVKRAFPTIKCNRKGPRGHTKQVHTTLTPCSLFLLFFHCSRYVPYHGRSGHLHVLIFPDTKGSG